MVRIYVCFLLLLVAACSQSKHNGDKDTLKSALAHRNTTYNETDVLLALKYQLDESKIKAIATCIKGEFSLVPDNSGNFHLQVDTNYALTVRTTIDSLSSQYKLSSQLIASILIDRKLLELPSAVGDEVVERIAPIDK
jgi:hypothetical protein